MTVSSAVSNRETVLATIAAAARGADRSPDDIALTIVSKTWDSETIRPLLAAGHRQFGENRVQEAQEKWPELRGSFDGVRLHLIGQLQSNKAADALDTFDVIETLDREKLANVFAKLIAEGAPARSMFVQVNTGEEEQKGGIDPTDAVRFAEWARDDLELPVVGMMAIPPIDEPPAPHFALLHELSAKAGLPRLSMGMSADYVTAVHLGATDVRVGSEIFGSRS